MRRVIRDEQEMLALGGALAQACRNAAVIYLRGELGAGKTTLVRGFMRGMGYGAPVKSPTYTLIEPYELGARRIYHLDLYRVREAGELAHLGIRDLYDDDAIMLVEWPERGGRFLPPADVTLDIDYASDGRHVILESFTAAGNAILQRLSAL